MKRASGLVLVLAAALGGGCSGINASKSISPLDFLLPGLLQQTPRAPEVPRGTNTAPLMARAADPLLLSYRNDGIIP
jgi:hypothetical protein